MRRIIEMDKPCNIKPRHAAKLAESFGIDIEIRRYKTKIYGKLNVVQWRHRSTGKCHYTKWIDLYPNRDNTVIWHEIAHYVGYQNVTHDTWLNHDKNREEVIAQSVAYVITNSISPISRSYTTYFVKHFLKYTKYSYKSMVPEIMRRVKYINDIITPEIRQSLK